jgi:hypothetical protein
MDYVHADWLEQVLGRLHVNIDAAANPEGHDDTATVRSSPLARECSAGIRVAFFCHADRQ